MVGRKPKPTALKIIQGNPGRRPLNRDDPTPGPLGKPPSLVKARAVALAKWLELVSKECWGPVITLADADALEAYCLLYDRMSEAETKAAQFGMIIKAPSGFFVQSPWVGIANTCRRDMLKIASEFGGLPSSRSRLTVRPLGNEGAVKNGPDKYFS